MKDLGRKVFVGIVAIGLVALLLIYLNVFKTYNEKTEELEASNVQLKAQVADMKQYYDHLKEYNDESNAIEKAIAKIIAEYPADAREEDALMMAVDMQKVSVIQYDTITVKESELLYSIPAEEVIVAGQENLTKEIGFVEKNSTYSCIINYNGLKDCIQQVYSNPNRIGINNVSFSREEAEFGNEETVQLNISYLKGVIDVSFYSMTGTDKEYKAPEIPFYVEGAPNPFKLAIGIKIPEEEQQQ